jgi:hypothetical protein
MLETSVRETFPCRRNARKISASAESTTNGAESLEFFFVRAGSSGEINTTSFFAGVQNEMFYVVVMIIESCLY